MMIIIYYSVAVGVLYFCMGYKFSYSPSLSRCRRLYSSLKSNPTLSVGEIIDRAQSIEELLQTGLLLCRKGEEKLHYETQLVHQRRRQSYATNAINKIVKILIGSSNIVLHTSLMTCSKFAFENIIQCAFDGTSDELPAKIDQKDFKNYYHALRSCAILYPFISDSSISTIYNSIRTIETYLSTGGTSSSRLCTSAQLDGIHWACDRLQYFTSPTGSSSSLIKKMYEELHLPFKVRLGLVSGLANVSALVREVPFKAESLVTMNGKKVIERRETCFMAEAGVGGLAYSGKIMEPQPFSPIVASIRDKVHAATGQYFDCCLINLYRDGECACAYHSDPDMGTIWARETAIVSIGETRRFHLRVTDKTRLDPSWTLEEHTHCFHVFDGDVFFMFDNCQDDFEHAVMKAEGPSNNGARVSIVFKKSLPRLGGRRGHGIQTRKQSTTTAPTTTINNPSSKSSKQSQRRR